MKVSLDTLDCILRQCNLETIERFLLMNTDLRQWILANRKNYSRIPLETVSIEADVYDEEYPWKINISTDSKTAITVPKTELETINLTHFLPKKFDYKLMSRKEFFDVSHDDILRKIPKEWFRELENISISTDNIEKSKPFYQNVLKNFARLKNLKIEGDLPYSRFRQILELMYDLVAIEINLPIESEMTSTDDDLQYLMENAEKLEKMKLSNVKISYTAGKFIEFLKNTKFASSVSLDVSEWPADGEVFYKFVKEKTTEQEVVYESHTLYHEDNPPVLPNRYTFKYSDVKYSIIFRKDHIINDPSLLR